MENPCNNCFHSKVCKYYEIFQKVISYAEVLLNQFPKNFDFSIGSKLKMECNNYLDKNSITTVSANNNNDDVYMDGVKYAIYEIMKEAGVFGSSKINESGLSDDEMCAAAAEKIMDSYKQT